MTIPHIIAATRMVTPRFAHLFTLLTSAHFPTSTAVASPFWDGNDPLFGGQQRQPGCPLFRHQRQAAAHQFVPRQQPGGGAS